MQWWHDRIEGNALEQDINAQQEEEHDGRPMEELVGYGGCKRDTGIKRGALETLLRVQTWVMGGQ